GRVAIALDKIRSVHLDLIAFARERGVQVLLPQGPKSCFIHVLSKCGIRSAVAALPEDKGISSVKTSASRSGAPATSLEAAVCGSVMPELKDGREQAGGYNLRLRALPSSPTLLHGRPGAQTEGIEPDEPGRISLVIGAPVSLHGRDVGVV